MTRSIGQLGHVTSVSLYTDSQREPMRLMFDNVNCARGWCSVWLMLSMVLGLTPWMHADDQLLNRRPNQNGVNTVSTGDQLVLRFKVSPSVQSQVVRLGDLVEIVSWGTRAKQDLLAFPLGPAPQIGNFQDWTSRDLIRNLEFRGINSSRVAWQGPESVRLMRVRDGEAVAKPAVREAKKHMPSFLDDRLVAQAETNLIQATRDYLWMETNERTPWLIELKVPAELANTLAQKRNILEVSGGQAPWTGRQRMVYLVKHQAEELELIMTVDIQPPTTVVVAKRAIRRDEVIDEGCLDYAPLPERLEGDAEQYFSDMSELVGKQMRKAMSTGVPIPRATIAEPNIISSGELIEIESVAGSIVVKAAGKALNGGAMGDLINVEIVAGRKRVAAIVAGPGVVRISSKSEVRSPSTAQEARADTSALNKTARSFKTSGEVR